MQLELHLLQSFPPANLNRDENGMPKSTVFGGRPRARISSQCQKRAARLYYQDYSELKPEQFAHRSRAWMPELKAELVQANIDPVQAEQVARLTLEEALKVKLDEKGESKTILFLGKTEIAAIANILINNWNAIEPELSAEKPALPKKDPNLAKVIEKALVDTGKPGDVALFGRMMASLPTVNVDASVQVAHGISVHSIQQEFDFFTAVDDLSASDDTGADHMGEIGYNSATYYRFSTLDTKQLENNLGGFENLEAVVKAFMEAFIKAIPTGHQNGFAAHSLPATIMVVARNGQPVSLADAFENPVSPRGGNSLLENAVARFDSHWGELTQMYGDTDVVFKGVVARPQLAEQLKHLQANAKSSVNELLENAIAVAFPEEN